MSKNIVIQEGGEGRQFTNDKLKTDLAGGGTCLWVPKDEVQLGTKNITQNGTYKARTDGYYGYSQVTVNVQGGDTITGKDPETGEETQVGVDPGTGEITETVVPTEIRVTTPPTKTSYAHGETIDYSGIRVHAYSSTGRDLGEVPFNELVFPVTTADAQQTDIWTDGHGLNAKMLYYTPHWSSYDYDSPYEDDREFQVFVHGSALGSYQGRPATYGSTNGAGTVLVTKYNGYHYGLRIAGSGKFDMYAYYANEHLSNYTANGWLAEGTGTGANNTKFSSVGFPAYITDIPSSTVDPEKVDPSTIHGTQSIPVQWPNSSGTLATSFSITVT